MKHLFTAFLFFIVSTAFSQKCFIGMTSSEVKEYWATKVSTEYFYESKDDAGNDYFALLYTGETLPTFDAAFDKTGKCIQHQSNIKRNETSVYATRFKKAGFKYNEKTGKWYDPTKKVKWGFEEDSVYYLTCSK